MATKILSTVLKLSKFSSSCPLIFKRGFKSEYSLDKIYPQSSLDLSKPKTEIKSSSEKFSGYIPIDKLDITYSRSSGPGGQHVNKVNSKVEVRFHLQTAAWIPEQTREKLSKLHHNSITKEGFMVVKSDKTRMQTLNLADCMDKLRCYIREAEKPPPEVLPETLALMKKRHKLTPHLQEIVEYPLHLGYLHRSDPPTVGQCSAPSVLISFGGGEAGEAFFFTAMFFFIQWTLKRQEKAAAKRLYDKRYKQSMRRYLREGTENVMI